MDFASGAVGHCETTEQNLLQSSQKSSIKTQKIIGGVHFTKILIGIGTRAGKLKKELFRH